MTKTVGYVWTCQQTKTWIYRTASCSEPGWGTACIWASFGVQEKKQNRIFSTNGQLLYFYDVGDTTEMLITIWEPSGKAAERISSPAGAEYIASVPVHEMQSSASFIRIYCSWGIENPFYCTDCAQQYEHDMLLLVTNSLRMNVYGWCGGIRYLRVCPAK